MQDLLVKNFYDVDNYCIAFEQYCRSHFLTENSDSDFVMIKSKTLSLSEVMIITIYFHLLNYRTFKAYYKEHVSNVLKPYFPKLVSYNRFVELMQEALIPLLLYMKKFRTGKCTGISFIDSTTLDVCHNRRIHSHKVFKGIAEREKSSTGWLYGFKFNLIISDKGYLSQRVSDILYPRGIQLITKLKKNMKNKLMLMEDKILLRKRAIIETINDHLKNICQIEHSRHRSFTNFMVNIVSGLVAYSFLPKKPSLRLDKYPALI